MRLFVALELPASARRALSAWAQGLAAAGLRPVPAAHLHVTLCFLGETDPAAARRVGEAVAAALDGSGPVTLAVSGSLWLPPRRPRVLAVGVDGPGLAALQARVAAALVAGGWYEPERRPYLGHVTVARVRGARPAGGSASLAPPALSFAAASVAVVRSHLGPGPVRYEALTRAALPGPDG